ncbi:NUDIX domain-containing protein [Epidermidibacterium keratini]|uniref:NUDIX domain-containing protein n=1 Tax=Epidermidibacterium keratini TaxID=1891644 RepID=A0A7L4YKN4_9ACTN|nr:NUDIX hydrolase [Epidermidibacterium keratini]QHB99106.1 NUDIX domain-containing protein [Epidermidibacterium keratini]
MDWSQLAQTSGDVSMRLVRDSAPATVELLDHGTLALRVEVDVQPGNIAHLQWIAEPDASVNSAAHAMRALVRRLFAEFAVSRVQMVVPADDRRQVQIAMRSGLRREAILRGGLFDGASPVDAELFASLSGDPAPESAGGYTYMLDSIMAQKRLISHVVMTDPQGRVLLCQTTFKKDWELPGGIVEDGERPRVAAEREVEEEIGLQIEIGRLLAVDWLPPYLGWSDAIELLYDGGEYDAELTSRLEVDPREIVRAEWFTVDEIADVVSPLNARRLPLLLPQKPEHTLHLESGELA